MKKVYVLILLSFFILLSACGSQTAGTSSNQNTQNTGNSANPPAPGGYLATGSNYVLFIQFTNTNGILSGEWDEADETTDNPPQVRTFNSTFSANLAGTQFNLNVNGRTYAGSFDGSNFTIEFPQTDGTLAPISLSAASIDDYNNAVRQLQQNVSQQDQQVADNQATALAAQATAVAAQAAAKATTDEQNRLNYDLANIGNAINSLNSDANFSSLFQEYQKDIGQEQKDYQTEQTDAKAGCSNASVVAGDASVVSGDVSVINRDDSVFQGDNNVESTDISGVQDFVSKIEQHWNNLGKSSPGVTQNDIDTAVHSGNSAIQNAQAAVSSATSQTHGYDATAQQILQQADKLSSSMKC